jgi:hypothetical protein
MLREEAQQAGGAARTEADPFWRCTACGANLARDRDRIPLDGTATRAFVNPDGREYVIAGFADARGCVDASEPSSYWSWFPGCSWQVELCAGCGVHLGWRFSGAARFYGLIVDRLTAPD